MPMLTQHQMVNLPTGHSVCDDGVTHYSKSTHHGCPVVSIWADGEYGYSDVVEALCDGQHESFNTVEAALDWIDEELDVPADPADRPGHHAYHVR